MSDEKLDRILEDLGDIKINVAVIQNRVDAKDKRLEKVETDTESLKKFKWGVVGTGGLGLGALLMEAWKWVSE